VAVRHFDHVTVVVRDLAAATRFFGLLGFEETASVVIAGERFDRYMGVAGVEAEHHTLVLAGASPRCEVQLLRYLHPEAITDPYVEGLQATGLNHVCFAVDDIEGEVARLRAAGIETRNQIMDFHDRKLVFLRGPEGITVELAEWHQSKTITT
jgi:catechol 2,3-dioxygenase-like lactoylglutathione lyase family enzyme